MRSRRPAGALGGLRGLGGLGGIAAVIVAIGVGCGPAVPAPSAGGASSSAGGSSSPAAARPTDSAGAASRAPATATPRTRAGDLEILLTRLATIHNDPFLGTSRQQFEANVRQLGATAASLTANEFMAGVMRLLAGRPRDGHTGVVAFGQAATLVEAWPLALYEFEEGIIVAGAQPPYERLLGARLTAVGSTPIDEARRIVAEVVPGDNEWSVRARVAGYLAVPAVLDGLGLLPEGEPALTLAADDGSVERLTPETIPMSAFREMRGLFDPLVPPSLPPDDGGPAHLRNRDRPFWSERLDGAVYIGYNQVRHSIAGLAEEVGEAAAREDLGIVVDLRNNPGGENSAYPPLRDVLLEAAARRPGSVAVIAGRSTFSAASQLLSELRARAGDAIVVVGEPSGGAPNGFHGDPVMVSLPASGLVASIAARIWTPNPADTGLAIEPDVRVPVTWADVGAGRDPALDAALEAVRPAPG